MATDEKVVAAGESVEADETDVVVPRAAIRAGDRDQAEVVQRDPEPPLQDERTQAPSTDGYGAADLAPFNVAGAGRVDASDFPATRTGATRTPNFAADGGQPSVSRPPTSLEAELTGSAQLLGTLSPGAARATPPQVIQVALPPSMPTAPTPTINAGRLSPNVDFGGGLPPRAQPSPIRQPQPDFVPPPLIPLPSLAVPPPRRQPSQEPETPDDPPQHRPPMSPPESEVAEPVREVTVPTTSSAPVRSQSHSGATTTIANPPRARSEGVSDAPTKEDRLTFRPYVDAVAAFLLNLATKPPFTMSIEGEWGAGKSSFLAQLADALVQLQRPQPSGQTTQIESARIVRFSPWRHEKDESLWASFAVQFVKQTKPETLAERVWAWAKLAWQQFDFGKGLGPLLTAAAACALWLAFAYLLVEGLFFPHLTDQTGVTEIARWWEYLKTWIPGLIGGGGLVGSLYKLARTATPRLDAKLNRYLQRPDYANKLSFLTSFHEDFAGYVETHIRARQRIFVLVDDLDRCDPLQAAELLKAINLMIPDGLPLVFIIAIDRLKVAAGIAAGQEKLLPFILEDRAQSNGAPVDRGAAIAYGYEFLEKFVQLPFRLPRMGPQNVARFIASLVGKAEAPPTASAGTAPNSAPLRDVATDSPLVSGVLSNVAPLLNFNPRRLKQFLNLFRLRHYVLESTGRLRTGEPTLAQLGKVVALEIRWPRLVEDILRRPSLLQGLERAATDSVPVGASETLVEALATRPTPDVHWMGDELLLNFLRSGSEADRIGALDLGAILGAAPNALELERSGYAVQTATVTMVVNRADGSVEPPITVGSSDNKDG